MIVTYLDSHYSPFPRDCLLLLAVGEGGGGDRFLSHHKLRLSVGPVFNPYPHNGVCVSAPLTVRANYMREQFAQIIRVSVKWSLKWQ